MSKVLQISVLFFWNTEVREHKASQGKMSVHLSSPTEITPFIVKA